MQKLNDDKWLCSGLKYKERNEDGSFDWAVTTFSVDLDGEVLNPHGAKMPKGRENISLLWSHGFDPTRGRLPIGRIPTKSLKRNDQEATVKVFFDSEDDFFARMVENKVINGSLDSGSVGFRPLKVSDEKVLPGQTGIYIPEFLILEFSITPVASNMGALRKEAEFLLSSLKMLANNDDQNESLHNNWKDMYSFLIKTVVPYKRFPLAAPGISWDASAAETRVRRWAGGPNKDDVDFPKYRKAFTWYDTRDAENFRAYKLQHHDVINGTLKTVLRGVYAAMGALLGARGGVDVPESDRRGIYNHLSRHYKDFDKEPPEFKDYRVDDLAELEADGKIIMFEPKMSSDFVEEIAAAEVRQRTIYMTEQIEQKAGRRLSRATIRLLNDAINALQKLINADNENKFINQQKLENKTDYNKQKEELNEIIRSLNSYLITLG